MLEALLSICLFTSIAFAAAAGWDVVGEDTSYPYGSLLVYLIFLVIFWSLVLASTGSIAFIAYIIFIFLGFLGLASSYVIRQVDWKKLVALFQLLPFVAYCAWVMYLSVNDRVIENLTAHAHVNPFDVEMLMFGILGLIVGTMLTSGFYLINWLVESMAGSRDKQLDNKYGRAKIFLVSAAIFAFVWMASFVLVEIVYICVIKPLVFGWFNLPI